MMLNLTFGFLSPEQMHMDANVPNCQGFQPCWEGPSHTLLMSIIMPASLSFYSENLSWTTEACARQGSRPAARWVRC